MSKTLLSFLISELKAIRVKCRKCGTGAVIECPVDTVALTFRRQCSFCKAELTGPGNDPLSSHLTVFAEALKRLKDDSNFEFELVVQELTAGQV